MTDVLHEKFAQLMSNVETLEDQVYAAEKEGVDEALLVEIRNKLAEARNRLAELSNGCGTGHSHTV